MNASYAPANKIFDWLFVVFAGLWTVGAFIDGWAHIHLDSTLESFFTPWHAIFYLGIATTGLSLVIFLWLNHKKGYAFRYSLPKEYMFSLAGVILATIGGIGDMLWHTVFGIEDGIEALLSPTHLLLAIGGAMAVAGPLYAVWYRRGSEKIHAGPTIFSATYFISVITFMLQFLYPANLPWMSMSFMSKYPIEYDFGVMLGVANILVFTIIIVGLVLSTARHWLFPFGSFTFILTANGAAMVLMRGEYFQFIVTSFVAGILIDICYWLLVRKNHHRMSHIHLFSFSAPFIYFSIYMATIFITDSMIWSVHMWTGAIFISGIMGYLLSYLILPGEK